MIKIYTDGSCLKNPGGPGGWAYLIENKKEIKVGKGGDKSTTNNRMELIAVIEGIKAVSDEKVCIYTDSQYVIKCAKGEFKRHKNKDLWKTYDEVSKNKIVSFEWVKGHNGDINNEKVDLLAKNEAKKFSRI